MVEDLQSLVDGSPTGLMMFQAENHSVSSKPEQWVCVSANDAAAKLLGNEALLKLPLESAFPKSVLELFQQSEWTQSIDFQSSVNKRWVLASANRLERRLVVSLTDITAQKEALFTNRKLMRLYQSLSDSLSDCETIFFDQDYNVVLTEGQPRFIRLKFEGDIHGHSLSKIFEENEFSFLKEYLSQVFGSETRNELEREINGRMYKASLYNGRKDDETQLIGVLLLKDVTELSQKQREINARIEQLNRSNKELETFAYVASHDLMEPLRKIKSFGERLQSKYAAMLQTEGQMYIQRMSDAARRMEKLIDDLLTFSRATRREQQTESVNLGLCVQNALANLEVAIEEKHASIEMPEQWPVLEAVPSQMEQLFQNLIKNSLRFSKKDQHVVIKMDHYQDLGISFPKMAMLMPDQMYSFIRIKDNGIGFEQENAERIFTIFQRLNGRSEYEGSGIGLSICKKIVENHGGAILAQSAPGVGAIFTIALPLVQEKTMESRT